MTTEEQVPPVYVDGIIKLHTQLAATYKKALKVAGEVLGFFPYRRNKLFCLYVDLGKDTRITQFKGYFMHRNIILRFLPIVFDKALLYPIRNHGGGEVCISKGITENEIVDILSKNDSMIIRFGFIPIDSNHTFFMSRLAAPRDYLSPMDIILGNVNIDDLGPLVYGFQDIQKLQLVDVPDTLKKVQYKLVDKQYYAPLTTDKEIHCALFAETNNSNDPNAVKVLRWLPGIKGKETEPVTRFSQNGGDYFFELGYVAREENLILHKFMCENDSRLLFGRIRQDKITIDGGIKMFQSNKLKYPRCLYNIPIV